MDRRFRHQNSHTVRAKSLQARTFIVLLQHKGQDIDCFNPTNSFAYVPNINAQSAYASVHSRTAHHHQRVLQPKCPHYPNARGTIGHSNVAQLCPTVDSSTGKIIEGPGILSTPEPEVQLQIRRIFVSHCSWSVYSRLRHASCVRRSGPTICRQQRSSQTEYNGVLSYRIRVVAVLAQGHEQISLQLTR